jgi:hypothetical protein
MLGVVRRHNMLGRLLALSTKQATVAKFDAVTERLTAIMPLGRGPSFSSIPGCFVPPGGRHAASAAAAAATAHAGSKATVQPPQRQATTEGPLPPAPAAPTMATGSSSSLGAVTDAASGAAGDSRDWQCPQHPQDGSSAGGGTSRQLAASGSSSNLAAAGMGALAAILKIGGGSRSSSIDVSPFSVYHAPDSPTAAAAAALAAQPGALAVQLRGSDCARITCISCVLQGRRATQLPASSGASPAARQCVWWAVGERLEFYSEVTQSTTTFAPRGGGGGGGGAPITALAVDLVGNVWVGTAKGAIVMRRQRNWDQVFVQHAFASSVRCLAADADSDVVWAGDEAGRLAVFRCARGGSSCARTGLACGLRWHLP